MNLEEAKANIGKEVIYIGNDKELIDDVFKDKKLIISEPTKRMATNVLIEYDELCFWNIDPQYLKLKEQPMKYKIKVTPETSAEVQELFFELGYSWVNGNEVYRYPNMKFIYVEDGLIFYRATHEDVDFEYQEITLPQLHDLVVLKRNDVGDATHTDNITRNYKYYVGANVYTWEEKRWHKSDLTIEAIKNGGISLKAYTEITWQDALRAVADGKSIDMKFNGEFNRLIDLLEAWLSGKEFRFSPQRRQLNGKFTKEELLKIVGEMG